MRERQADKPNFLRDLNAAIFAEMAERGNANIAGMAGELKSILEVADICGLPFDGYMANLETMRPSNVSDEVIVAFTSKALSGTGAAALSRAVGGRIMVGGKVQTLKNFKTGRVLVFVLADFVTLSPKAPLQNDIALMGELAYPPTYRTTPRGRRISDMIVKTQNALTAGTCYIPCICWNDTAEEAANWHQGDKVRLLGRYQSREYIKLLDSDTGESEKRTAHEISVNYIEKE